MGDAFFEETVPKKTTAGTVALKVLLIFVTAAALFFGLFWNMLFLALFLVLLIIDYFMFPRFKAEYEYSYANGDIDMAVIFSKESRKELGSVELSEIECVAPCGSDALSTYGNTYAVKDYSGNMSAEKPWAVVTGGENRTIYYMMLTEDMVNDLKYRIPRKVFTS